MAVCMGKTRFLLKYIKFKQISSVRNSSKVSPNVTESDYTETPVYPPIRDPTPEGRARFERFQWYESLQNLPTPEQKMLEIVKREKLEPYLIDPRPRDVSNTLPWFMHCTRTHLEHGLPDGYFRQDVDELCELVKPHLREAVLSEYAKRPRLQYQQKELDSVMQENIIYQTFSSLVKILCTENISLQEAEVDVKPRCESFWWHGHFYTDQEDKTYDNRTLKSMIFQFRNRPELQTRMKYPLPPVVSLDDPLVSSADVPEYPYSPKVMGFKKPIWKQYVTSLPGTWPARSVCEFPFISMQRRSDFITEKTPFQAQEEIEDLISGSGILTCFGWLNAIVVSLGFTPFNEITYPIVTQHISTDGKHWKFFVYQLNTIQLHSDFYPHNPRKNLCWTTKDMQLFDNIENGELMGLNDEVLKNLIRFFLIQPQDDVKYELRPYLGGPDNRTEEEKVLAFEELFSLYENRISIKEIKEEDVPMWVKIYKNHPDAPLSPMVKLK